MAGRKTYEIDMFEEGFDIEVDYTTTTDNVSSIMTIRAIQEDDNSGWWTRFILHGWCMDAMVHFADVFEVWKQISEDEASASLAWWRDTLRLLGYEERRYKDWRDEKPTSNRQAYH